MNAIRTTTANTAILATRHAPLGLRHSPPGCRELSTVNGNAWSLIIDTGTPLGYFMENDLHMEMTDLAHCRNYGIYSPRCPSPA